MTARYVTTALLLLPIGCLQKDYIDYADEGEVAFEDGTGGEVCEPPSDCPDCAIGCEIIECSIKPITDAASSIGDLISTVECDISLYFEPDHWADIDLYIPEQGTSAMPWNAYPWNVDAGELEHYGLIGAGTTCGTVSFDIRSPYALPEFVQLICTDNSAGFFSTDTWQF